MFDGTERVVEELKTGDQLFSIEHTPVTVVEVFHTLLSPRAVVYKFADGSLSWAGGQLLWVRAADGFEGWATHDYNKYMENVRTFQRKDLVYDPHLIVSPMLYAHTLTEFGPKNRGLGEFFVTRNHVVDHAATNGGECVLYTLELTGNRTFFANGYLLGANVDNEVMYEKIKWFDYMKGDST